MFGLPEGERVRFEIVNDKPWSGFNYYEGGLSSLVAINTDLPVLSPSIGHLVAHEAYPGHHTEHCLKEVGLVRQQHHDEESIFLVGAPQCLMAEGLADLGLEVLLGGRQTSVVGEIVRSHGVNHDDEVISAISEWGEMTSRCEAIWRCCFTRTTSIPMMWSRRRNGGCWSTEREPRKLWSSCVTPRGGRTCPAMWKGCPCAAGSSAEIPHDSADC